MPNGKHGDNPLSDLTIHGVSRFPADIESMLRRVDELGKALGQYPLGENWPFVDGREFDWERGNRLDEARRDLALLAAQLEAGRGADILRCARTGGLLRDAPKPIFEHDPVVLCEDRPRDGLRRGDVGSVVHEYRGKDAYEVEFPGESGQATRIATIPSSQLLRLNAPRRST